jgi:hypothetical protein
MLGGEDLSKATLRQVHRAIHEHLLPSDKTFLEGMAAARSQVKRGRKPAPYNLPTLAEESTPVEPERPAASTETADAPATPRPRGGLPAAPLEAMNPAANRGGMNAVLTGH